jgi:ParB/RepB/Spo0J family partition protein
MAVSLKKAAARKQTAAELDAELNDSINASSFHDEAMDAHRRVENLARENERLAQERADATKREMDGILAAAKERNGAGTKSKKPAKVYQPPAGNGTMTHGPKRIEEPAKAGEHIGELVRVDRIVPSRSNPREHFDEKELMGLADSITGNGVLQPLQVRRLPRGGNADFELIAGERRWRAAQLAGLELIPCIVRGQDSADALNDAKILEIQVIENEQRADLSPIEKARGYKELIEEHGWTVENLAKKIGKSTGTIYGLLKLLNLPANALKAVVAGDLPSATAQLIGRIPDADARQDAAKKILRWEGDEPASYRTALDLIQRKYMVELKKAPFSQKDATLVPSAGACTECPNRTGNNPEYADSRPDVCTDPVCYRTKLAAHQKREIQLHKDMGRKVITGKEAEKIFTQYQPTEIGYSSPYVDLAGECYEGNRNGATYKKLLGNKATDADITLVIDRKGDLHELVNRTKAHDLLGIKASSGPTRLDANAMAKARADNKKRREREKRILTEAAAAGLKAFTHMDHTANTDRLLRCLLRPLAQHIGSQSLEAICPRRQIKAGYCNERREALAKLVDQLQGAELLSLAIELRAASVLLGCHYSEKKEQTELAAALGISLKG